MARLTAMPFTWQESLAGRELTAKQIEHRDWATKLGIVDTFVVPIHYPGGDYGLTSVISDHVVENPEERTALQMASIYAHLHCRELDGVTEATSVKAPLTPREIECLRWVLKGKSDTDIGAILNISHTTVHFHIERVKKKLGVKTRTQAAGLVVTLGYI
jgi:DNA-binding CsgD family transcriptional regulator